MLDENPRLYLVTPILNDPRGFMPALEKALDAGDIACVLLRHGAKEGPDAEALARLVAKPVQARGVALIIEGSPDTALRAGADGLHVNGYGEPLLAAIKRLSPGHIVGCGALVDRDEAMRAGEAGADYLLFGDFEERRGALSFSALLERTSWWAEIFNTPCVAFANTLEEVGPLKRAGADFIMLGDCVWSHPGGSAAAVRAALTIIGETVT
jgi:thiamine-phosphate pyrophosphorylase